jgi:branched-chain amino acid transport system permease protein
MIRIGDSNASRACFIIFLLCLAAMPFYAGPYLLTLAITCMIAAVGAIGLNLLTGTTGLVSLGQSGFLAVGAYTNTILIADYGWPVLPSIAASGLMSGLVSLLVGIPSLRLRELYLSITTLAFAVITENIILQAESLTRGAAGKFLPATSFLGFDLSINKNLYWFILAVTVLVVVAALNLLRSRVGRAWIAIRDHEMAARVMGISVPRWKLKSFFVSSLYAGIAGALLSLQIRFINVDVFGVLLSIEAIAMIILGGVGSVAGAIAGAVFLSLLPEVIRAVSQLFGGETSAALSQYLFHIRGIAYGIVIIAILRLAPAGFIGLWRKFRRYWTSWPL